MLPQDFVFMYVWTINYTNLMIKRFIVSNGESSLATFFDIIEKVQNSYIPNEIREKELISISYTRNSMTTMTTEDLNYESRLSG